MTYTCMHRFVGDCPDCKKDYDPTHKPNNYDCPRYYEINISTFEVQEPGELELKLDEHEKRPI